jgi:hypothetical protein
MRKLIALDANLLVLLVVGLTKSNYIATHKRLKAYTIDDYTLLTELIPASAGMVVTPNVLSEASNLLRQIGEPARSELVNRFRSVIQRTGEVYVISRDACSRDEFVRLGLSDSAMLEIRQTDFGDLSTDANHYIAALNAGYEAQNFNHCRNL